MPRAAVESWPGEHCTRVSAVPQGRIASVHKGASYSLLHAGGLFLIPTKALQGPGLVNRDRSRI